MEYVFSGEGQYSYNSTYSYAFIVYLNSISRSGQSPFYLCHLAPGIVQSGLRIIFTNDACTST